MIILIEEGRRQKAEGRRKNCLWIVNDRTLRVLVTPSNFHHSHLPKNCG
ncbi:MAG: hypothetical protein F6K48_07980 [Okeania sp. SIO3H1]|nr:hypothetical protein [Okeania sp. SIO1I7]NEN88863.1 hypothetical protein [Okeania sp. SIO3H1]NET24759.1 hypothetical protein [Okeania sp. SIO1I7]